MPGQKEVSNDFQLLFERKWQLTARGQNSAMNVPLLTLVGHYEDSQPIAFHGLQLVTLAPIDIWSARLAGTIDDMSRADLIQSITDGLLLVHAGGGSMHIFALLLEELDQHTTNPAFRTPNEETILRRHVEAGSERLLKSGESGTNCRKHLQV